LNVSIVIVNYNVRDLLLNAIASVRDSLEGLTGEIIVVDNASSDGAIEEINRRFPEVVTIPLERNIGFGGANNIGIERARGEYVLLLNPDTIVEENTLRTMIAFMEKHPDAGFASSKVILADGSFDAAAKRGFPSPWSSFCRVFGLSRLFPKSKLFGGYNLTYLDPDQEARVEAICGCFMFCRGDLLKQLGGFDTDFFMYGEDLDLCYRARQAGWEIYYHPGTTIVHLKGESTRRSSIDALAVFYEAMEIFARTHFRSNRPLLWLVHAGIAIRRLFARLVEAFPNWPMAGVDAVAVIIGFILGVLLKTGTPLLSWSNPITVELLMPPVIFVITIALAGGYRSDEHAPRSAISGYLFGSFVLSTLTYFFREYASSRGILLATTGVGMSIGVAARFLWLLWRRTYGAESLRRVAFLGREEIDAPQREAVRRLFFGRPVAVVGRIAPTFTPPGSASAGVIGAVENIRKIIRESRLTDIVVFDSGLRYGEVMQAIGLAGSQSVRFHIASETILSRGADQSIPRIEVGRAVRTTSASGNLAKRLRDRVVALVFLLFLLPAVYSMSRRPAVRLRQLLEAVRGIRPLVGSGPRRDALGGDPLFTVAELCQEEDLSPDELAQLDSYYLSSQSLLLDCEIIISAIRLRGVAGAGGSRTVEGALRKSTG
jgi:GT2 family glycosyltransferase